MKLRVIEVTKQDELKIVQVESVKECLLLEDEISPGCIQYIVSNLSKHGKESKETCDKMCRILCNVYIENNSSRKMQNNRSFRDVIKIFYS